MSNCHRTIPFLAALACASPAWSLEGSNDNHLLLGQPAACDKAWLMQYCPHQCSEASACREAIVDHRLEEGDCMAAPLKAVEKIHRGCDACAQVFCH